MCANDFVPLPLSLLWLSSFSGEEADSSMHDNDVSNGSRSFRLIVNNAIMTLKKDFDLNIEHVRNVIYLAHRANDISAVA